MSTQLLIAALVAGSIYALIALGLNLVYGTMRLINVAHGEVVMIGAYVAYWGISLLSVGPLISALAAIPIAMALGAAIYFGIFRKAMQSAEFMERIEGELASGVFRRFGDPAECGVALVHAQSARLPLSGRDRSCHRRHGPGQQAHRAGDCRRGMRRRRYFLSPSPRSASPSRP